MYFIGRERIVVYIICNKEILLFLDRCFFVNRGWRIMCKIIFIKSEFYLE